LLLAYLLKVLYQNKRRKKPSEKWQTGGTWKSVVKKELVVGVEYIF